MRALDRWFPSSVFNETRRRSGGGLGLLAAEPDLRVLDFVTVTVLGAIRGSERSDRLERFLGQVVACHVTSRAADATDAGEPLRSIARTYPLSPR